MLLHIKIICKEIIIASTNTVEIPQGWVYSPNDTNIFAFPDYNDIHWKSAPKTINLHALTDWMGIGWFRLHFRLDSAFLAKNRGTLMSLVLWHRNASEIYVDGVLLRRYGEISSSPVLEREEGALGMPIPLRITDTQSHVLAIRFSNNREQYLAKKYPEPLINWATNGFAASFTEYESHVKTIIQTRSLRLVVGMIPLGILLYLALQHGLMYAFTKRERLNLYVALLTLAMAALCFSMTFRLISTSGNELMIWNEILIPFEISMAGLFLGATVDWIVHLSLHRLWWRITLPLSVVIILTRFFINPSAWSILLIVSIGIEFVRIAYTLSHADKDRRVGTGIIGFGMAIFFLAAVATTILGVLGLFQILWLYVPLNYLLFLSIPVALAFFTARRFDRINAELSNQLDYIKALSEQALEQEQEKQRLMERQKEELERLVEERTQQLQTTNDELNAQKIAVQQANMQLLKKNLTIAAEQEKSEGLLLNILPEAIAQRLKNGEITIADKYDDVTVLFADIAGFTRFASHIDPQALVALLDKVFSSFDALVEEYGVEKIKTIGDAYMVVGGLQHHEGVNTATIARLAIAMQDNICKLSADLNVIGLTVRIGIHRGAAVAGVIGKKKPNYDLWGDTVNIASRMESHGEAGKIHVSEEVYLHLRERFIFRERGEIRIKGKGTMRTYFLEQERV
jgi:class 3 adenylate cyclase